VTHQFEFLQQRHVGRHRDNDTAPGVSADTLNQHYASVSSDSAYQAPQCKVLATCEDLHVVSELEHIIIRNFLYSAITQPPSLLNFSDQFAFRPTRFTTAALIAILHSITDLLFSNPYVIVLALDFGKAFDLVRQYTLLQKVAMLHIPDTIYNWLVDFFSGHCTRYQGLTSTMLDITATVVQGSAVEPVSYVINIADLNTLTSGNHIYKYADDTYIVIPAGNAQSRATELNHVAQWVQMNNLQLNRAKTTEIIFSNC